jgi:hypothetical protein
MLYKSSISGKNYMCSDFWGLVYTYMVISINQIISCKKMTAFLIFPQSFIFGRLSEVY